MQIGFMSCQESVDCGDFQAFGFASNQSLLEFDLVVWEMFWLDFDYKSIRQPDKMEPQSVNIYGDEVRRLISDRKRRLREFEWLMQTGRTLVILCPAPIKFYLETWNLEGMSDGTDIVDNYSFLPVDIQEQVRNCASPAWGKRIEFRGDDVFLDFWRLVEGIAWYSVYFTSSIGIPFLYIKETDFSVATWLTSGKGNIFLIPGKYDDSHDDDETFVEAAKYLVVAANTLSGKQVVPSPEIVTENFSKTKRLKDDIVSPNHDLVPPSDLLIGTKAKKVKQTKPVNTDKATIDEERLNALRETLRTHYRNLNELEKRAAYFGLNIPIEIMSQIDYLKGKIEQIREEIATLSKE